MYFKLPIKILLFVFLLPIILFLFSTIVIKFQVNADPVEKTLKYTYTFSEDKSTNVLFEADIENNDTKNLLKSYVFSITDGEYSNLSASVNGTETQVQRLNTTSNKFQINFSTEVSNLKKDIVVRVTYTTKQLIDQYGNLLNLYIPYVKKSSQTLNISYTIDYPSSFGSINFASMRDYQISSIGDRTIVKIGTITNPNGGYFSIGDNQYFDFKIVYDSIESKIENERLAMNIPQISNDQELFFYTDRDINSTILVDQYENQFIRYISPKSINLGMQLIKSIGGQKINEESAWKALYYTDETNLALKKYYTDNFSKIDSNKDLKIFDKVTSDYKYKHTDVSANQPIDKILAKTELNSLEFSVLLSNLYNLAGYKSRVVGGIYMGGDNTIEVGSSIWFWVEYIGENGVIREVDPSLTSASGFDYFTNDGLNHIKVFNYADPLVNLSFGDKLLMPGQYKISAIGKIDFQNDVKESVSVMNDLISSGKTKIYSGTENSSTFTITNTSEKVLNISRILVDNEEINLNLETNDGYRKLLFPGESLNFDYPLKVFDWSFSGKKTFDVKVYANLLGTEELIYSNPISLDYQTSNLVILFSWILKLLLSLILVTIFYVGYKFARKLHRQRKGKRVQIDKLS